MGFILRNIKDDSDYEWVIRRHREIYSDDLKWDADGVEKITRDIVNSYISNHDDTCERWWIAEDSNSKDRLGCILCVRKEKDVAQLRLLLVDSKGRGMGIGSALVNACVNFAKETGYSKIMLWTNHPLTTARKLYEKAGFVEVDSKPHNTFGVELIGQNMWLDLK